MPFYYAITVRLSFSYFVLAHTAAMTAAAMTAAAMTAAAMGGVIPPVPPCLQKRVPLSAHSKLKEAGAKEWLNCIVYVIHYDEYRIKTDPV